MPRGLRQLDTPKRGENSRVDHVAKTATGFFGEHGIYVTIDGKRFDAVVDAQGHLAADTPQGRYRVVWG